MAKISCLQRLLLSLCTACVLLSICDGQCTFPSDLTGVWYTSHEPTAEKTWTSTQVSTFTYTTQGSTFNNIVFECYLNSGDYYVVRSTTNIVIFTVNYRIYSCWTFTSLSSNKYLYRQATTELSQANARIKILPTSTTVTSYTDICDQTSWDTSEYSILLKNDTASSEKIACPDPLLMRGIYTISDSSTSYCNGNSWLDGCTASGTLTANYTLCSTDIFYSGNGEVYCMYYTTYSATNTDTYYVTLWNTESNPDESSTYYFSCAVVEKSGSNVYMTQYAGECLNSTYMNATYMNDADGHTIQITTNSTCVPSSGGLDIGTIVGIVFGCLIFIILVVVIVYLIYTYVCLKKKDQRPGSKVVPDTLPNTSMSQADKTKRMMFTPAPPRSAGPGGRQNDYYDGGRVGSEISLRPTVSQLANYRTPTPFISDSKVEEGAETTVEAEDTKPEMTTKEGTFLKEVKSETPGKADETQPNETTPVVAAAAASVLITNEENSPKKRKPEKANKSPSKTQQSDEEQEKPRQTEEKPKSQKSPKKAKGSLESQGRAQAQTDAEMASDPESIPETRHTPSGESFQDTSYDYIAEMPGQPIPMVKQAPEPRSGEAEMRREVSFSDEEPSERQAKRAESAKEADRPVTRTLDKIDESPARTAKTPTPSPKSPGTSSKSANKTGKTSTEKPPTAPKSAKASETRPGAPMGLEAQQRSKSAAPTKSRSDNVGTDVSRDDLRNKTSTPLDMVRPEDIQRIKSADIKRMANEHKKRVSLKDEKTKLPKKQKKKGSQAWLDDKPKSASSGRNAKDMDDVDSILDFDNKRFGEPDGAESGVMVDMEGSLPVFSESGDLTPEPTRVTPHGKIEKTPRKPKPTPANMPL